MKVMGLKSGVVGVVCDGCRRATLPDRATKRSGVFLVLAFAESSQGMGRPSCLLRGEGGIDAQPPDRTGTWVSGGRSTRARKARQWSRAKVKWEMSDWRINGEENKDECEVAF